MAAVHLRSKDRSYPGIAAHPLAIRRITAWLVGGDAQEAALDVAFKMAAEADAALTGLSAIESGPVFRRQAVPAGGGYWAAWQAGRRRQRMREQSVHALAAFEAKAAGTDVNAAARHEEGDLYDLTIAMSGCDLIVAPAAVDRHGAPTERPSEEIASIAASSRIAPVMRVRRPPHGTGRVALLVDLSPTTRSLAQNFLRSGVFPDAAIAVLPIGDDNPATEALAHEFADLIDAHGRDVDIYPSIPLDAERDMIAERLKPFDLVATTTLSGRYGWFGSLREDVHEIAADTAPIVLLA